jgi:diguanylate cyclase (GGDEF)-like protein
MHRALKRFLASILKRIQNELTAEELTGLVTPRGHYPIFARHRMSVIISRVRTVAALFAVLTPLWIAVDVLVFPWPLWFVLALARLAASAGFAALAWSCDGKGGAREAYRSLAFLFGIPVSFFILSHSLLSYYEMQGVSDAVATGYTFLPFVMVAGLAIFPLTALEGLSLAMPVVAVEAGIPLLRLDQLSWSTHLGAIWLLLLIAVVSTLAGMSQLGFMMALVRQATRDRLTGCFTRASGEELLDIQFNIAARNGTPLTVVFIDLDDFKPVNDIHGHEAGDRVLAAAAGAMRNTLRGGDILIRWGGEEFVLLLPNTDGTAAISLLERLRAAGLGVRPDGVPVTASFGLADRLADGCADGRELLELADQRMYAAKQAGKNVVVGFPARPAAALVP